jgi:hypothetical protein
MSHGVHAVQHEVEHEIKHGDQHSGHGSLLDNINKKVALLIGVFALFLAFSETLGKSAQTGETGAISYNMPPTCGHSFRPRTLAAPSS